MRALEDALNGTKTFLHCPKQKKPYNKYEIDLFPFLTHELALWVLVKRF